MFKIAIELAKKSHKGQTDRAGKPYIDHILTVVKNVESYGEAAMTVAALHDIIEDTPVTEVQLRKLFPAEIIDAVVILTKTKIKSHEEYLMGIKKNRLAKIVKLADLKHNSDLSRIKNPTPKDIKNNSEYLTAIKYLEESRRMKFSHYINEEAFIDSIFGKIGSTISESSTSQLVAQPWENLGSTVTPKDVESLYNKISDLIFAAKSAYERLLKFVSNKDDKILIDVKKISSFVDKIVNRGKKSNQIFDLLRGAILAPTRERVDEIVHSLKKKAKIKNYEFKEFKTNELGYFGSHHFTVEVGGVLAEIQVMTKKLWTYKHEAHKIYTELRSGTEDYTDKEIREKN